MSKKCDCGDKCGSQCQCNTRDGVKRPREAKNYLTKKAYCHGRNLAIVN